MSTQWYLISPNVLTLPNIFNGIVTVAVIYLILDLTDRWFNWSWTR